MCETILKTDLSWLCLSKQIMEGGFVFQWREPGRGGKDEFVVVSVRNPIAHEGEGAGGQKLQTGHRGMVFTNDIWGA